MKIILLAVISLGLAASACQRAPNDEKQVRQTVEAFYAAFNSHGFAHAAEFTAEEWQHINTLGG